MTLAPDPISYGLPLLPDLYWHSPSIGLHFSTKTPLDPLVIPFSLNAMLTLISRRSISPSGMDKIKLNDKLKWEARNFTTLLAEPRGIKLALAYAHATKSPSVTSTLP